MAYWRKYSESSAESSLPNSPREVLEFAYGPENIFDFSYPFSGNRIQARPPVSETPFPISVWEPLTPAWNPKAGAREEGFWSKAVGSPVNKAPPAMFPKSPGPVEERPLQLRPIVAKKRNAEFFTNTQTQDRPVMSNMHCPFCEKNGETEAVFRGHNLRERGMGITCPILFTFTCPHCGATGHRAHTESHCPRRPTHLGPSLCRPDVVRNSCGKFVRKRAPRRH